MSLPQIPTREAVLRLLHSADETDRKQGIIELIRSHDALSRELLEHIAAEDPSVEIRYFARRALASLDTAAGEVSEAPPPVADHDLTLLERLQSTDHRIRLRTLRECQRLPLSDTLPALCRSLVREGDPRWQARFLTALGRLRTPDAVECILPYLQNRNTRVRANAVEALGSICTRDALKPLVPLLSDDDNRVKANVIQALHRLGSRDLLELLRQLAQDSQIWMRDSAIFALSRFDQPEAREILETISRTDPSDRLRQKALALLQPPSATTSESPAGPAQGLVSESQQPVSSTPSSVSSATLLTEASTPIVPVQTAQPLPPLRHTLWEEPAAPLRALHLWQRLAAGEDISDLGVLQTGLRRETDELCLTLLISLLRQRPAGELFAELVPHLDSPRTRVRAAAIETLSRLDQARAMTHAYALLEDVNNRVRANAVLVLIAEPLFPALTHLRAMARDPRETWRLSVLYVLHQKPRPELLPLLGELLDDASERVRDAALQ
ncbi:MAG TPA: HEAT repeat domain-containing protein, partial [Candidatus Ozemobacteraceae bacterium]|nr:HEAT repeat domain-containing protein [Candidatus Ozemobacteraceae bacterium]